MEKSRTEYSVRNTSAAMVSKMIAIIMGYMSRVVFTRVLSISYVGINGLFFNILNIFSLTELGIGTAITYTLYKPIAEGDLEKQKSLMQLYCRFYRLMAGIVLAVGLAVIPFLDILIKNRPEVDHLVLIYLLYLANSVCSYLLIYKRILIDAHQMLYIGVIYQTCFFVIQNIGQIIILLCTKNFILYLLIYLLCTFGNSLCVSRKAVRLYPYLREKQINPLEKKEKHHIVQNIRAMMMHKVAMAIINNTDNLLLSAIVGITSVACYFNYFLLIGSVRQVLDQTFQGIAASVGNLSVTSDKKQVRSIFEASFFIGQWMYGLAAICLYELLNPFVELSFGKQYLFGNKIVFVLCLNFFIIGTRQATLIFRDSLGLFWYDRYKAPIETVLNLGISIVLAKSYGTIGVFLGTLFSTLLTSVWVEPWVLYKRYLKTSVFKYFAWYAVYTVVIGAVWYVTDFLCGSLKGSIGLVLLYRLMICILLPNVILFLCYFRKKEFRFLLDKLKRLLKGKCLKKQVNNQNP